MSKKKDDGFKANGEPFEIVLSNDGEYSRVLYCEKSPRELFEDGSYDENGISGGDNFSSFDRWKTEYQGIWILKLQQMMKVSYFTEDDGTETADIDGIYYNQLESKCIHKKPEWFKY